MEDLTLKEFLEKLPNRIARPANVFLVGGLLLNGKTDHDIDLLIEGVERRPEIKAELQAHFKLPIAVDYFQHWGKTLQIYKDGKKAQSI